MIVPSDITHGGFYVQGSASLGGGRADVAEQFQNTLGTPAFLTSAVVSFRAFGPAAVMSGTATLFSDFAGAPGSILETAGFSANLVNNAPTLVTATFSGTTLLAPGTNYWVGFSMLAGSSFWAQWNFAQPAANDLVGLSSNGNSWNVATRSAAGLTVNGRIGAVPEPATYGLIGACAMLGFAAWRRRSSRT